MKRLMLLLGLLMLVGCETKLESISDYEEKIFIALADNDKAEYERLRRGLEKQVDKAGYGVNSVYCDLSYDNALKIYENKVESQERQDEEERIEKLNLYDDGICKELEGAYTSQGVRIIDCSYSSSKDRISITVKNNSGSDLKYVEVEIYGINSNGQTISSDFTNHGSTIRNGAMQTLERYVDYANSYEVEITEARMKK